ncbi:apolipoprotein N-acyltransferase [Vitreimonas flagellata]|uniref:apolipoprotein N-acyltransferase n=1 Tax=Vitreimonas flagellata TaxID=2560861 RepID=UPI0014316CC3|nr:apolipoprotein N-acyltransferase [Vitreimonas flagellata]
MTASNTPAPSSRIHEWLAARSTWQRRGIATAVGALATLGHAPFQLTLVFVAAITILVWLLDGVAERKNKLWSAFGVGFFFGLGHLTTGLYWVASAFNVDSGAWGPIWGIPATLGLAAGLSLFWAAGCALAMIFWTSDARRIPWFAVSIFASEWLRGHLFGGFPWLLPGYVWTPGEPVSQLASIFGIYGLTLLTLLVAATPAAIGDAGRSAGLRFAPIIVAALLVGMGWGWGAQRLDHALVELPGTQPIVRVTDSGLSQSEKWVARPDQEWRVLQRYLEASGPPEQSRASIVIWPEGAIPTLNFFMLENPDFMDAIGRGMGDRVLITGLTRREALVDRVAFYNSAAVIDGVSGVARLSQTYDKNRLVPFGEFIPLWSVVSRFNIAPLQRIGAGFDPGAPPTRLVVPEAPPAVVLICYEAIFPGMVPRGADRPGWIVSVTNDAWFGGGSGPYQHYAMARYRAIEEGLPMARAAAGGVSAIIDSYGREVSGTMRRGGFAEAQIPPALVETTLAHWGNILLGLLLALIAALRFFPRRIENKGLRA